MKSEWELWRPMRHRSDKWMWQWWRRLSAPRTPYRSSDSCPNNLLIFPMFELFDERLVVIYFCTDHIDHPKRCRWASMQFQTQHRQFETIVYPVFFCFEFIELDKTMYACMYLQTVVYLNRRATDNFEWSNVSWPSITNSKFKSDLLRGRLFFKFKFSNKKTYYGQSFFLKKKLIQFDLNNWFLNLRHQDRIEQYSSWPNESFLALEHPNPLQQVKYQCQNIVFENIVSFLVFTESKWSNLWITTAPIRTLIRID